MQMGEIALLMIETIFKISLLVLVFVSSKHTGEIKHVFRCIF